MTAERGKDRGLFPIGMRVNRPLAIRQWLPVFASMPPMLRELQADPESGYLGGTTWASPRAVLLVHYRDTHDRLVAHRASQRTGGVREHPRPTVSSSEPKRSPVMPERIYQISAGVVLLIVLTIACGGTFVLSVSRGNVPANDLQRRFFRAGHAHAGVLGLLTLTLEELNHVRAPYPALSFAILAAAVLLPAGFFLSVIGREPARPNRAIALLWTGAAVLAVGLVSAGAGLIAGA